MKTPKVCKDCHHAPSGRTAEYGAACQCSCHDVADAAPDLLAACQAAEEFIGDLPDNNMMPSVRRLWEKLRAAIALTRSH